MPLLTLEATSQCPTCGCRQEGFQIGTFRINKGSLVCPRGTLAFALPKCPECSSPLPWPERFRLDEKSLAIVNAHRTKKGWEVWDR